MCGVGKGAARFQNYKNHLQFPRDPATPDFIALREQLCDTERIVLYTLEFDVAVQHPYGIITAQVKRWRDDGLFGSREEKSVEAQTIDRAAAEVAFSWCVFRLRDFSIRSTFFDLFSFVVLHPQSGCFTLRKMSQWHRYTSECST